MPEHVPFGPERSGRDGTVRRKPSAAMSQRSDVPADRTCSGRLLRGFARMAAQSGVDFPGQSPDLLGWPLSWRPDGSSPGAPALCVRGYRRYLPRPDSLLCREPRPVPEQTRRNVPFAVRTVLRRPPKKGRASIPRSVFRGFSLSTPKATTGASSRQTKPWPSPRNPVLIS